MTMRLASRPREKEDLPAGYRFGDANVVRRYNGNITGRLHCGCRFLGETGYPCEKHVRKEFERQYGTDSEELASRVGFA